MVKNATANLGLAMSVLIVACSEQVTMPEVSPDTPDRRLQPAINGETGVSIKINGQNLTDPALASRLRVDVVIDSGRPTFGGNPNNKTIQVGPLPIQASSVAPCAVCEVNVIYHDAFGSVPTLDAFSGVLADGDYTVKLFRDGSTLVGSKAIAINHPDVGGANGTFLDETGRDQIVTFFLNQNLLQISSPTVDFPHTRASTHLTATITSPSGSEITIGMCDTLKSIGSGASGVGGTKKFAWDWDATGGNT